MWENFVNKECIFISDNLTKKLIVVGTHLKVSSFNGLSTSTKANSSFLFDSPFQQAMHLRYCNPTFGWRQEPILGSSINHSGVCPVTIATRSRMLASVRCTTAYIVNPLAHEQRQEDSTGSINGTMIGDTTEVLLQRYAKRLMELTSSGDQIQILDEIRITAEENHIFYIKAIKKDSQMDHFKYDIIFMMETSSLGTINEPKNVMDKGSDVGFISCYAANSNACRPLSSTVKHMLFESPCQPTPNKWPIEEHVTTEIETLSKTTPKKKRRL
ncbi:replication protein A 70 kDa DNA-binding subunit B-like [Abeliophyllum distichum]|uniref:Replication protein A 70 kDa DNA-binding subunit B-like n=1 Tax=Abeliophyllum distichum TaxID=126358 RepID=A0ABD1PLT5_9LAMI